MRTLLIYDECPALAAIFVREQRRAGVVQPVDLETIAVIRPRDREIELLAQGDIDARLVAPAER
jgi:hypothetical protein